MTEDERKEKKRKASKRYRDRKRQERIERGERVAPGPRPSDPDNPLTGAPRIGTAIDSGKLAQIDKARGEKTRSQWLRNAIEEQLKRDLGI